MRPSVRTSPKSISDPGAGRNKQKNTKVPHGAWWTNRSNILERASAVYARLGMDKREIEKGRPWQDCSETMFNVQCRMANWHFQRAGSWAELVAAHDRFVADYNAQSHFAH